LWLLVAVHLDLYIYLHQIQEPDVVGAPMKQLTAPNGVVPQLHKGATPASEHQAYYASGGGATYSTVGNSGGGGGGMMPPTQSIVAMDESAAYSRAGDKSDIFGSK